nr:ell-associated factor Eaf-like [Penaeus vannamei]
MEGIRVGLRRQDRGASGHISRGRDLRQIPQDKELTMSSKRKSLPTKVLDSYSDASEMLVEDAPPLVSTTAGDSDNSAGGSEFSYGGCDEGTVGMSPARWSDSEVASGDAKRSRRESSADSDDLTQHLHPFANPYFQARLQEARLRQEHDRLLQEAAAARQHEQQQQLHHLQQQQQQHSRQQQQQGRNSLSPLSEAERGGMLASAARKSMDDVLKRLTSKMSHSTIDDAERAKRERESSKPPEGRTAPPSPPSSTVPSGVPPLGDQLASMSQLLSADPEALQSQEKRITEIIAQLQKLRDSIRQHQPQEPQHEKKCSRIYPISARMEGYGFIQLSAFASKLVTQ